MSIKNLTSKEFDGFIKSGISIVDFYADWCGPCKIMEPILEEAAENIRNVKFGRVDIDKENELAQRFEVMSIPTLIFFKGKEQVDRASGVLEKEELAKMIGKISK